MRWTCFSLAAPGSLLRPLSMMDLEAPILPWLCERFGLITLPTAACSRDFMITARLAHWNWPRTRSTDIGTILQRHLFLPVAGSSSFDNQRTRFWRDRK